MIRNYRILFKDNQLCPTLEQAQNKQGFKSPLEGDDDEDNHETTAMIHAVLSPEGHASPEGPM